MATRVAARIKLCFGKNVGVCRTTPASFALATMLPLNVAAPMMIPRTPENCPTARQWAAVTRQLDERSEKRGDAACPVLEGDHRGNLDHVDPHGHEAPDRAADRQCEDDRRRFPNGVRVQHDAQRAQQGEGGGEVPASGASGRA